MTNDDTRLQENMAAITGGTGTRKNRLLPAAASPAPIPERIGSSLPFAEPTSGGGSGIGSPIIEDDPNGRTYFAEQYLTTTDGVIYSKYKQIQQLNMTDSASAPLVFIFRQQA